MKREILFRGYDKMADQWIYGTPAKDRDIKGRMWMMFSFDDGVIVDNPETIGQFTGKRDVMKARIFEGDIVQFTDYGVKTAVVVWLQSAHAFVLDSRSCGKNHTKLSGRGQLTVIGNIHENPELLKWNILSVFNE